MIGWTLKILLGGLSVAMVAWHPPALAEEPRGPWESIKTAPLEVVWQYSNDGGQSFQGKPLPGPPSGGPQGDNVPVTPFVWKGTFQVDDPAKVAGLWVRIAEDNPGENGPRASICNGNLVAASGGYWRDLGFTPTLLDAVITFNGQDMPFASGPLLQFWVPLVGEIKQGVNTIELRGNVYNYWHPPATALDAQLIAAAPQAVELCNGPILGDWGDDYFTVACRTPLPAEVTVAATPSEPSGAKVTALSSGKIWHRFKIPLPSGTRKVSYTVAVKVGDHVTNSGPFAVELPGEAYRFVAYGGLMQQPGSGELWKRQSQLILNQARPDFVVNTGNLMEQESWSFQWDECFTGPGAELLARVPRLVTPCNRDFTGIFNELFYTPAPDGYNHSWTKVEGPVRFIGLDGNAPWPADGQNARWLEEVLAAAGEKYVIVICGYPAYSSGVNSKYVRGTREQIRDVVMPLLAKHKATLMLSSWDPTYERIEPTPDKGVTQIVTGCIAQGQWHRWDSRMGSHPFGPPEGNARVTVGKIDLPDGREWAGWFLKRHFCEFTVTDQALKLKVIDIGLPDLNSAQETRQLEKLPVLEEKTFAPRN